MPAGEEIRVFLGENEWHLRGEKEWRSSVHLEDCLIRQMILFIYLVMNMVSADLHFLIATVSPGRLVHPPFSPFRRITFTVEKTASETDSPVINQLAL